MNKKKIDAKNEINASGLIIAPGFIDAHTHDDFFLLTNPSIYYKLEQGVTTSISGNCGIGLFPLNDLLVEEYRNMLAGVPEGDKIIEIAKNFTDFEHLVEAKCVSGDPKSGTSLWSLANDVDDFVGLLNANKTALTVNFWISSILWRAKINYFYN